jgi:hypothetical protein
VQEDAHVGCLGIFLFVFLNKEPAVLAEKNSKRHEEPMTAKRMYKQAGIKQEGKLKNESALEGAMTGSGGGESRGPQRDVVVYLG